MYGLIVKMYFLHLFILSNCLQLWKCSKHSLMNYGCMRKTGKGEKEETL